MSLLNSQSHQLASEVKGRLKEVLLDIVENVEISADFSIRHPNYQPWEMPAEMLSRIQALPKEMQDKYMSLQLRSFLYGVYYNGSMQASQALGSENKGRQLDLENNSFAGVAMDFYVQLEEANKGEGYFDSGWSVLREETDGSLAVTKGGLRLHIQRKKHLQESEQAAALSDFVSIMMPKNLVQNGFYMAVGNAGLQGEEAMVRVYFNFTPEGAVAVMAGLTERLNQRGIPFSFKALYNPVDYQRYDAGVLYFGKTDYELVRQIVANVYQQNQSIFKPEIPLFTLELAPGLGLAEEPDKKFGSEESFGMNRCQIIANGLLMAWQQGDNSATGRMAAISEQFSGLGIDWQRPYLNADSEDVYRGFCPVDAPGKPGFFKKSL
jgi:HopA1 effector protein family